jgi:hypothetical protein
VLHRAHRLNANRFLIASCLDRGVFFSHEHNAPESARKCSSFGEQIARTAWEPKALAARILNESVQERAQINEYIIRIESSSQRDHSGDLRSHEARFHYE